jgi:subtilisin family serine protease
LDLLDKRGGRIELARLDAADLSSLSGTCREGVKLALPGSRQGPPAAIFQETATGLLRVVHCELVVRFRPAVPEQLRRAILRQQGFQVRRTNRFIPDQAVVFHPKGRFSGEDLLEISNHWTSLDEVVFASPSFLSQYRRQAPPSVLPEEWHLQNHGLDGAKAGEDINVIEAWKETTGRREIVVAILDDGVDIGHPNLQPSLWRNPDREAKDRKGRDFFLADDDPGHYDPRPKRFRFPFDDCTMNDIHGTSCAGLVVAAGRKQGSVGVAPGCRLLPVRIFQAGALAADERVADAIRYAALHADILSCSWSGGVSPDVQQALEDAGGSGTK